MKKPPSRQLLAINLARLMAQSLDLRTANALGKRSGVSHTHVGRALRAESGVSLDILDSLAGAFGLHAWELLTDAEATRRAALERMMFGAAVSDERVEGVLPPPPDGRQRKTVAMRRRRKG